MTLSEWVHLHRDDLLPEPPNAALIADLKAVVDRELEDAATVRSDEGRLEHAFAACLAAAHIALMACGYRLRSGALAHHYLLLESLTHTLQTTSTEVQELQEYRRKRSRAMYERVGVVTRTEADAALRTARILRDTVNTWLAREYPQLT